MALGGRGSGHERRTGLTMDTSLMDHPASQPRIGVALGGGGLKAMSAIALFRMLQQHRLTPNALTGCSAGALVAAMCGAGFNIRKMQDVAFRMADPKLFSHYQTRPLLGIASLPGGRFDKHSGLMNPSRVMALYRELFGELRLEDLQIKTALVATDVSTGEKVVLEHGPVADAVMASGALWPLFPPHEFEGRLLMDGGYADPMPLLDLVNLDKSDVNIAMMFDEKPDPEPKSFAQCLNNQVNIMLRTITRSQNVLAVEMEQYETIFIRFMMDTPVEMDPASVPLVLEAGRRVVRRHTPDILSAVNNYALVHQNGP